MLTSRQKELIQTDRKTISYIVNDIHKTLPIYKLIHDDKY